MTATMATTTTTVSPSQNLWIAQRAYNDVIRLEFQKLVVDIISIKLRQTHELYIQTG